MLYTRAIPVQKKSFGRTLTVARQKDLPSMAKIGSSNPGTAGYKVEAATSPIEALALFRSKSNQYDLVITDLTMPKMTGDNLVKEILNIRPDIFIILCTGFSEKIDEKKQRR
jgi:CheY-like chemotaxis protein